MLSRLFWRMTKKKKKQPWFRWQERAGGQADVEMIVVKGKMLGQSRSKVVLSELKIYDLIKIILNSAFKESVYKKHERQLRNSADSLVYGGNHGAGLPPPPLPGPCWPDMAKQSDRFSLSPHTAPRPSIQVSRLPRATYWNWCWRWYLVSFAGLADFPPVRDVLDEWEDLVG